MRGRLFIFIFILLPTFFLFGLEAYLGRYDQHSKYLGELRDSLIVTAEAGNGRTEVLDSIISSINNNDFSNAAGCLWSSPTVYNECSVYKAYNIYKSVSDLDLLKGGYRDREDEYIKDFRDNIISKRDSLKSVASFDFEFDYLSDNDIESWSNFNQKISGKRYGFYARAEADLPQSKDLYINGSFEPTISYSNVAPIPGGRFRILAISDSFGAGHGLLSLDDIWAKELESQLNFIEDKYEVVVLAQNGAGYKDFLKWVEGGYIKAIDPDLVLLSYFSNDFNLLYDSDNNLLSDGGLELNGLDKELVFYLRCFEKDDDLLGRGLNKVNKFFPSIYRFYKFSSCGEELAKVDSSELIDKVGVMESYKKVDKIIDVPLFLYKIESRFDSKYDLLAHAAQNDILVELMNDGFVFINNSLKLVPNNDVDCGGIYFRDYENCEGFKSNKFDGHFNRYFNKLHIKSEIASIKEYIDLALSNGSGNRESFLRVNKNEEIIVDYLPNTLFVSNESRDRSFVGLIDGFKYGYGRSSVNFCVPFDRKGVVVNFNKYLTEGKEIKISSEYQGAGLGLVSRGYDKDGRVVFGEAVELKAGGSVTFLGSELVRGLVVLGNNRDCSSNDIDNSEEFLLEIEII